MSADEDFAAIPVEALAPPSFQEELRPGGSKRNLAAGKRAIRGLPLTEAGKEWLIACVDPFHDEEYNAPQYPDGTGCKSVGQLVRKTVTVARPSTVPSTDTWDCHIAILPINVEARHEFCGITGNSRVSATLPVAVSATYGPVTIVRCANGKRTFPNAGVSPIPNTVSDNGNFPDSTCVISNVNLGTVDSTGTYFVPTEMWVEGRHRINGIGIEVINPTPLLYQSGTMTSYKNNSAVSFVDIINRNIAAGITPSTGAGNYWATCRYMQGPPDTVTTAVVMPNSRQWPAAKGGYLVAELDEKDVEPSVPLPSTCFMHGGVVDFGTPGEDAQMTSGAGQSPGAAGILLNDTQYNSSGGNRGVAFVSYNNMLTGGLYATGLHPDTVLTINVRFLVEAFPSPSNKLITVARPVPEEDLTVWTVYKKVMDSMPSGVPLDENFTGKWFKKAASAAKSALTSPAAQRAVEIAAPIIEKKGPKGMVAAQVMRAAVEDRRASNLQHEATNRIRLAEGRPPITEAQRFRRREKRKRKRERRRLRMLASAGAM